MCTDYQVIHYCVLIATENYFQLPKKKNYSGLFVLKLPYYSNLNMKKNICLSHFFVDIPIAIFFICLQT